MKKFLSLQDIADQDKGEIFLLNKTGSVLENSGDVFITVNVNGTSRVAQIPDTWLPLNLTTQFPRKYILESVNFMEALSKGIVTLITPEYAAMLSAKEGAEEERTRLKDFAQRVRDSVNVRGLSKNTNVIFSDSDEEETKPAKSTKRVTLADDVEESEDDDTKVEASADDSEKGAPAEEVSARFKAWVTKLNGLKPKEALNALRTKGELSLEETEFAIENCNHEKVVALLKQSLAESE